MPGGGEPLFIVGSPMCRMFSALQNMSPWTARKQKQLESDIEHLKFMVEIYKKLVDEGRYFIHEHPAGASSWRIKEMVELLQMEDVGTVIADQCMYGLRTWKVRGEAPAKKSTKFATNSECVKLELGSDVTRIMYIYLY